MRIKSDDLLFYKDDETDFIMHHNRSMPRYKNLARKAISFYLGDLYNPHILNPDVELSLRQFIGYCVEAKVTLRAPYDWIFIDNAFKQCLFDAGFNHLKYDQEILEKGYQNNKYWPNRNFKH